MNNMLTVEEVKSYLEIEQRQLEEYLKKGKIHAYKIGGTYLRFRKEEVETLRFEIHPGKLKLKPERTFFSLIGDFWRFNNFYLVSLLVVALAIIWLVRSH